MDNVLKIEVGITSGFDPEGAKLKDPTSESESDEEGEGGDEKGGGGDSLDHEMRDEPFPGRE